MAGTLSHTIDSRDHCSSLCLVPYSAPQAKANIGLHFSRLGFSHCRSSVCGNSTPRTKSVVADLEVIGVPYSRAIKVHMQPRQFLKSSSSLSKAGASQDEAVEMQCLRLIQSIGRMAVDS